MRFYLRHLSKVLLFAAASACFFFAASAQTYTGEVSNRVTINLGDTPWKYKKGDFYSSTPSAKDSAYPDGSWEDVGVPHCFNATDMWLNIGNGYDNNGTNTYHGTVWYRKHFALDAAYAGRKIELEFQGVNIGCAVYVNGHFKPGISAVAQSEATHVISRRMQQEGR